MEITLLNETHAKDYWNLRLEMLKESPSSFGSSYEEALQRQNPIEMTKKRLSSNESFTFGLFVEKKLAGAVTMVRESALKMNHKASIYAMYVTPAQRGQGLARRLLERAINLAKETEGIEQLMITVVTTNETAKGLYHSCGFKPYGTEKRALKYNEEYYDEELMVMFLS
ncbi:GNAT family N-acetyltransferase [Rossellomorea sp. KS-H15a]|uniref:GNAT family N-acetyltransferase n=1 Tax=Rossellomorea sp. KS-H15a TaxID=2963940 RepID=UPI0020C69668|nr:GNAT family N-acetyltransferase [Rossellomorea sp. KS-H15a]UTE75752.1 GNAT family N-acetyltransferase [Rossellomorea sp. KS-H15a]